ncbi:unnamed protein product [Gulo gulo]|uniref:Uncharacterized protein n=1 Tax=Gulo gulo TaxID=48420 RepID=A0A9X9PZ61_GULGU|nr:unnamed protein product [Gulo gulo]
MGQLLNPAQEGSSQAPAFSCLPDVTLFPQQDPPSSPAPRPSTPCMGRKARSSALSGAHHHPTESPGPGRRTCWSQGHRGATRWRRSAPKRGSSPH